MRTSQKVAILNSGGINWLNQGTWTFVGGNATNTPSVSSNLLTNGGMENWTGSTPDDWSKTENGTSTISEETTTIHSGSSALRFDIDGSNSGADLSQNPVPGLSDWSIVSLWSRASSGASQCIKVSGNWPFSGDRILDLTTSYQQFAFTGRIAFNRVQIRRQFATGLTMYVDDIVAATITASNLITVQSLGYSDVVAKVDIDSVSNGTQCGLVICADDYNSPQNMVLVYRSGLGAIVVDKMVAGTWSQVSSTASAFTAGHELRVEKTGSTFDTYYNNVLVKSDTISDAGIVSNAQHGLFSTYSGNTLSEFSFTPN